MEISSHTNITGVFQSDLIIQSAIVEALKRIRDNPDEIDYIFQSLRRDELTNEVYGQAQIDSFKDWFLNQDVPVAPAFREDETKLPQITFALMSSDETDQTLGDIHYVPSEGTEADWPPIAPPFNPIAYYPSSGMMQIPSDLGIIANPGMILLDVNDRRHRIIDVLDTDIISLEAGTVGDFREVILLSRKDKLITTIESVFMKEVYQIGVHVQGEAFYLIALHGILSYALNKYKEVLLEARDFERSVITNTEFRRNAEFGNELVYSRWLNIIGYVKQIWAKKVTEKVEEVIVQPIISEIEEGIIISPVDNNDTNQPLDEEGNPAIISQDAFLVRHQ